MFDLSVRGRFSAAHRLRGYDGSCASVHGHNWDVTVFVSGEQVGADGMLVDFRELKQRLREALEALDHTDLNTVEALQGANPTSETMARHLFERLSSSLNSGTIRVRQVTVSETPETSASYRRDD